MKKLILTALGLVAGATLVHAQGYMYVSDSAFDATISSNSVSLGKTTGAANYDFAIFVSTTPIADGPTDSGWTQVENTSDVGIIAGGSALTAGEIIYNSGNQFQTGNIAPGAYYAEIVGWSANLGSSWTTVENELNGGFAGLSGYFGSAVSSTADFVTAVSSPGDSPTASTGVANGTLVLNAIAPVPEPATLALAGLGGEKER